MLGGVGFGASGDTGVGGAGEGGAVEGVGGTEGIGEIGGASTSEEGGADVNTVLDSGVWSKTLRCAQSTNGLWRVSQLSPKTIEQELSKGVT